MAWPRTYKKHKRTVLLPEARHFFSEDEIQQVVTCVAERLRNPEAHPLLPPGMVIEVRFYDNLCDFCGKEFQIALHRCAQCSYYTCRACGAYIRGVWLCHNDLPGWETFHWTHSTLYAAYHDAETLGLYTFGEAGILPCFIQAVGIVGETNGTAGCKVIVAIKSKSQMLRDTLAPDGLVSIEGWREIHARIRRRGEWEQQTALSRPVVAF